MAVHGGPGKAFGAFVRCSTNDPHHPELVVRFKATLKGRLVSTPPRIELTDLEPGQVVRRRIEIRDTGRGEPFRFHRAATSGRAAVTVAVADGTTPPPGTRSVAESFGQLVCILEVTFTAPSQAGVVHDSLTVYETGRDTPAVAVALSARVMPRLQVVPTSLVLPRIVDGREEYEAICRVSVSRGRLIRATVESASPGLEVESLTTPPPGGGQAVQEFRVRWVDADKLPRAITSHKAVRFRVETDSATEYIDVLVRCHRPD